MIKVNYAAMETAHGEIRSISDALGNKLDGLKDRLQKIEWTGSDREAYQAAQNKWDTAVRDMNAVLADIGKAVGTALENYQSTEMGNAKLWQ
jgi:early secretory antigenic target protein ESAT-6